MNSEKDRKRIIHHSSFALAWCRERMLVPGNPLVASLPFAPPGERDLILALRTVVGELAAVPETVSDPGVAVRKLQWWREALANPAGQKHPAIEAANETGLTSRLEAGAWDDLLTGVQSSLAAPRFEQFEELWQHCCDIGGAAAILEAKIIAAASPELSRFSASAERSESEGTPRATIPSLSDLGAAGYLTRVVRDLALDARNSRWSVPLDLQAGFQVDRQQVASGRDSRAWRALVLELLSRAHRKRQQALAALAPEEKWRHRHLLITAALDERLGRRLAGKPAKILEQRILPGGMGNLLTAWRAARRLKRSK